MRIGTPWTMVDSVPASQAVLSLQLSGFRGCLGYDGIYTQIVTPDTTQVLGFPLFFLLQVVRHAIFSGACSHRDGARVDATR